MGILAALCVCSVWPVLVSGSIPAFQQDWTWPLSRALALQWLSTFAGLWDGRGLGGPNTLGWQTYLVVLQATCAMVLGPSLGLALWLILTLGASAGGCIAMLAAFGVRSWPARLSAAVLYAFGPVAFTREAAGHLAYMAGYAMLPFAIALGQRVVTRRGAMRCVVLGLAVGIAASQVQFYVIGWLAVGALVPFVDRARGWTVRIAIAIGLSIVVQLQSLLPLFASAVPSVYAGQRALLSWELNNSSQVGDAAVMLGYFTRYYESHALPGAEIVLYTLLAAGLFGAIVAANRTGVYPLVLCVLGFALTAGLYGPLAGVLAAAFERSAAFTAFRDLHYFAALTAVGMALAIGLSVELRPSWWGVPALAAAVWIAAPLVAGQALREIIVPAPFVADALGDMRVVTAHGPGRVLLLPAEEPLGLRNAVNLGRDFSTYGPRDNPSISDDYQNPELAYALAAWRSGRPDWTALARMDVRYVVFRTYLRSDRRQNFGTGFPMAFAGASDAQLGASLARDPHLQMLAQTPLSSVYAVRKPATMEYPARVRPGAMRFSELAPGEVGVSAVGQQPLDVAPSPLTADPRGNWVGGTLGWRYLAWMPDGMYPFVWTLGNQRLPFGVPAGAHCVMAAATAGGVLGPGGVAIDGSWKRYAISPGNQTVVPSPGGVAALTVTSCDAQPQLYGTSVLALASGYDAGWRVIDEGRLIAPSLADGWMMAWPSGEAGRPRLYLPGLAQAAGLFAAAVIFGLAFVRARRADAALGDDLGVW